MMTLFKASLGGYYINSKKKIKQTEIRKTITATPKLKRWRYFDKGSIDVSGFQQSYFRATRSQKSVQYGLFISKYAKISGIYGQGKGSEFYRTSGWIVGFW